MRLPGFSAEASLYKTSGNYRMSGTFGQANGTIQPMVTIRSDFETTATYESLLNSFWRESLGRDVSIWMDSRTCCQNCLSKTLCADEQCRRQRLSSCSIQCNAADIGGCGCPPGRAVCEGECCGEGQVCTGSGCCSPNQVCNDRCCGLTQICTPVGCCAWNSVVCKDRCCPPGWSCTSEGCGSPGLYCESAPCPSGKFCCGGKICCPAGTECRLIYGMSEYGCFR
jgi:hypothetical protein